MRRILLFLFLVSPVLGIDDQANVSIGIKMSLLGIGGEGAIRVNNKIRTRLGINYFCISRNFSLQNTKYVLNSNSQDDNKTINVMASIRLFSVPFYVDYHPFQTPFSLTVGFLYNGNEFTAETTPAITMTYQGKTYGKGDLGTIEGKVYFENVSGFLGIRYDSTYHNMANLSFNFEAGILFQSAPKFSVNLKNATLQGGDIDNLMSQINADIQNIKIPKKILCFIRHFPIIGFELRYRF